MEEMEPVKVIQSVDSIDNAHITFAYPFGSNRCVRREWIEQGLKGAGKGQYRFGYQTTDRQFNYAYTERIERDGQEVADKWALGCVGTSAIRWNAPKYGTYHALAVMIEMPLEDGSGRIGVSHLVLNQHNGPEQVAAFNARVGDQLDDRQRKTANFVERVSRHFSPNHWAEFDAKNLELAGASGGMGVVRERTDAGMEMSL